MKKLVDDIQILVRTWEIWAITGFITLLVVSFNAAVNRPPSLRGVEDHLRRIERHLEVIDSHNQQSSQDRQLLKQKLREMRKDLQ